MKSLASILILLGLTIPPLCGDDHKKDNTFTRTEISYTAALKVIEAAIAEAEKREEVIAVAVADLGGHLIAFARMDEAKPAVVKIAIDKAYSSAIYRATTGKLNELAQPGAMAYGVQTVDRTITFQGGIPVFKDGAVIGAIGISGAAADVDEAIANAAAIAIFGVQTEPSQN